MANEMSPRFFTALTPPFFLLLSAVSTVATIGEKKNSVRARKAKNKHATRLGEGSSYKHATRQLQREREREQNNNTILSSSPTPLFYFSFIHICNS